MSGPMLRGDLRLNEPMARHGGWRVGGPARRFYRPADREDLSVFLASLPDDEPLYWIGLGSNVLVRDGGLDGTVICLQGALERIERVGESGVYAEGGATCSRLARYCAKEGLGGIAFLAGIPGTVGGALAMNAGANRGETWQFVAEVETIDRSGTVRTRRAEEFEVRYRHVAGPAGEWFIGALLELKPAEPAVVRAEIRALLERRSATQPSNQPTCGSVFKNPPGDFAGRLIESSGLKGLAIGGAKVSEKHANFIIAERGARAADIEALIDRLRSEIARLHGIELETEVRILGRPEGAE